MYGLGDFLVRMPSWRYGDVVLVLSVFHQVSYKVKGSIGGNSVSLYGQVMCTCFLIAIPIGMILALIAIKIEYWLLCRKHGKEEADAILKRWR